MPPDRASYLVPYIHNNPVRAGIPERRIDPLWTSHAAYVDDHAAPRRLAVEAGLELCGFGSDSEERAAFARLVDARASKSRDDWLSAKELESWRTQARLAHGAPIELTSPVTSAEVVSFGVVPSTQPGRRMGFTVTPAEVVESVCLLVDAAPSEVLSRTRRRDVVAIRRLAARVWLELGRPLVEMGRFLGIGSSSMSRLVDERSSPTSSTDHQRVRLLVEHLASRNRIQSDRPGSDCDDRRRLGLRGRPRARRRRIEVGPMWQYRHKF